MRENNGENGVDLSEKSLVLTGVTANNIEESPRLIDGCAFGEGRQSPPAQAFA
jgi:hypothetical protein